MTRSLGVVIARALALALALGICLETIEITPAAAAPERATPGASPRRAKKPRASSRVHSPIDVRATPAYRYAQLSQIACEAELTAREIPFVREPAPGVLAPVRLTGPVRGVVYRTRLAETARSTSVHEVADCRLVLALDDFASILNRHDIVEVIHYSMYRPPRASWPADKIAAQHAGALALDAGRFIARDGTVLDVDDDFHGRIGARTCGPRARPRRQTPEALRLRAIVCEAIAARLFTVVLTPNHDRGHKNHFHLELTAGVAWFLFD